MSLPFDVTKIQQAGGATTGNSPLLALSALSAQGAAITNLGAVAVNEREMARYHVVIGKFASKSVAASEFSRLPSWMQTEVNRVRYGLSVNVTAPTSNEVTSWCPTLRI
jgi:hypothetical protein